MMKLRAVFFGRAVTLCALSAVMTMAAAARGHRNQAQPTKAAPQASEGEQKAAQAVRAANDVPTAATAAMEFVKKYPKSSLRTEVARTVAGKLAAVPDPGQRATLAEGALKIFDRPEEGAIITPVLVDSYVDAKRYDDAFRVGGVWLDKNPDSVTGFTQMALIGIDQARLGNAKFVPQGQQYALKAAELMESNKKPAGMSDADWAAYKTEWLPQIYQSMGMLAYITKNWADADAKLEKAVALGAKDPTTYFLLADLKDKDYGESATKINAMKGGAERDAAMKEAEAKLDKVIELYAQTAALSEGKPGYEKIHDQVLPTLTSYYKYRKGSTDGLQQLIDKYKKPATTP